MVATARRFFVAMLLLLLSVATAVAQPALIDQATTPESSWALLRELPLKTRVSMWNPMDEQVEATLARVYPDRVVLTGPRFERGGWGRTEANSVVVRQHELARVAVMRLPRKHTVVPEHNDPRIAWRFASGQPAGTKVRVRKVDGGRLDGHIVTTDDQALTMIVNKQPTAVPFADVREIERRGWWTTGRTVGVVSGVTFLVLWGVGTGLER